MHGVPYNKFYKFKKNLYQILNQKDRITKFLLACVYAKGINEDTIEAWTNLWNPKPDLMEIWTAHNWSNSFNYRELSDKRMKTCGRVFNGPLQVQVDGTVNACCFDWNGVLQYGDLKKQSLPSIFSSMEYDKIAFCHRDGEFNENMVCATCDQRNEDKKEALIYSSKFDLEKRVKLTSTAYDQVQK